MLSDFLQTVFVVPPLGGIEAATKLQRSCKFRLKPVLRTALAMNTFSKTCVAILVVATVSVFVLLPPSVTLSVGDPGSKVNQIARYGYGKSVFNLGEKTDAAGVRLDPTAFSIGPNGYHLLIWHNGRIDSMRHFRYEQPVPNTYGDWHDSKLVESFTVPRPSVVLYFVGLMMSGLAGFSLARFRRTFILLLIFLVLTVLAVSVAILPVVFAIGWVCAALIGRSVSGHRTPQDLT